MDKPEIEFVCELQRLQLKEGDRFVMTFDGALSRENHERIQEAWKNFVSQNREFTVPLLILDRGAKLGVVNVLEAERQAKLRSP